AVGIETLVACDAPDIGRDAVFLLENFLCGDDFVEDGATAEQLRTQLGFLVHGAAELIHALEDALLDAGGHGGHGVRFIHDSDVVEDSFALFVHAANAVLNDDGNFVGVRGIVSEKVRYRESENMAVAVLVLQAFTGQGGTSGGAAEEESASAHIGGGPDEVGDALKSEHRIVDKKWNGGDAMRGIGRSSGDEGSHGAGFGDALFKDLAVFRFLVIEKSVDVDGFVFLADAGIDADGAEKGFHTEGARFVGNDGHDELADFGMLQHFAKHGDKGHGGGNFAAIAAVVEFAEEFVVVGDKRGGADFALWRVSTEGFAASLQIVDFLAVVGRAIERNIADIAIAEGNAKARAELAEFVLVEFHLLVGDVLAFAGFTEAVTFNRARQDDGGAALVFEGGFVGGID